MASLTYCLPGCTLSTTTRPVLASHARLIIFLTHFHQVFLRRLSHEIVYPLETGKNTYPADLVLTLVLYLGSYDVLFTVASSALVAELS